MYRKLIALAVFAPTLASAQAMSPVMRLKCWDTFNAYRAPGTILSFEASVLPGNVVREGRSSAAVLINISNVLSKEGSVSKLSKGNGGSDYATALFYQNSYNFHEMSIAWAAFDLSNNPGLVHSVHLTVDFKKDAKETMAQGTYTTSVEWLGRNTFPISCKATR